MIERMDDKRELQEIDGMIASIFPDTPLQWRGTDVWITWDGRVGPKSTEMAQKRVSAYCDRAAQLADTTILIDCGILHRPGDVLGSPRDRAAACPHLVYFRVRDDFWAREAASKLRDIRDRIRGDGMEDER